MVSIVRSRLKPRSLKLHGKAIKMVRYLNGKTTHEIRVHFFVCLVIYLLESNRLPEIYFTSLGFLTWFGKNSRFSSAFDTFSPRLFIQLFSFSSNEVKLLFISSCCCGCYRDSCRRHHWLEGCPTSQSDEKKRCSLALSQPGNLVFELLKI